MRLRRQDVDRLLGPEFSSDLGDAPVATLRERRDECMRAELVLSYLRRLLQGELDVLLAEIELRSSGAGGDLGRLVEELPAILSPTQSHPPADHPLMANPLVTDAWLQSRDVTLEDLVGDAPASALLEDLLPGGMMTGANVSTLSDEELSDAVEGLRVAESELSRLRRAMHERIDEIQAAIVERYKTGAADVDSLLR